MEPHAYTCKLGREQSAKLLWQVHTVEVTKLTTAAFDPLHRQSTHEWGRLLMGGFWLSETSAKSIVSLLAAMSLLEV